MPFDNFFYAVTYIASADKSMVYLREHCLAMIACGILGSCKFHGVSPMF